MKPTPESNNADQSSPEDLGDEALRILIETAVRESFSQGLELFGDCDDAFVNRLKDLNESLNVPDDAHIIYSGSSTHVGVARVFGKKNVVHVDPEEQACDLLSAAGYIAEALKIEDYHPDEKADVLVALNSYGTPSEEVIRNTVKPGGVIITNNYSHWANELNKLDGVTLKAALMPSYLDESAELVDGGDIPSDATALTEVTYSIDKDGRLNSKDPDANVFTDVKPKYPDALFVFQVDEQ